MRELKNKERKILKVILLLSVIASMYFGLKGVFIDLYNPGSPVARYYSDIVNWVFVGTLIIALPLLIEKFHKLSKWHDKLDMLHGNAQTKFLWNSIKPIMRRVMLLIALVILASIVISWYWQIPPDVMANYQDYYQRVHGIENINITEINNMTINLTSKR